MTHPGKSRPSPRNGILQASLCFLVFVGALVSPVYAPAQPASEFDVKAAFLLNFVKFVDWPPSAFAAPDSPIAICILGADPFGRTIDTLVKGEVVGGRRVIVERISRLPSPQSCHVIFTEDTLKDGGVSGFGQGVLTVGDGERFLREGGMISFVIENRRVRFDINRAVAEAAGLKLSSRLLTVARAVQNGSGEQ